MNNLEAYFQGEYKADFSELSEIDELLRLTLPTFTQMFVPTKKVWPYKVRTGGKRVSPPKYSTSTNSMILTMMKLAEDNADRKHLFPSISSEPIFNAIGVEIPNWTKYKDAALSRYTTEIRKNTKKRKGITFSATYGNDDPLSLLWCAELLEGESDIYDEVKQRACNKVDNLTQNDLLSFPGEKPHKELNVHSFISLRLLQLLQKTACDQLNTSVAFDFFERRLHLHLSYSNIPDSRFDPAELVFSLEGALRTKKNAVSHETIERAFRVLEESQNLTPYWRPINPIYATAQGQILLPLSVEVANSLLRTCAFMDNKNSNKPSIFSEHSEMFKRYFRWLKAQLREVDLEGRKGWGWASEHVGGEDEIHLFQTSEIVCFLINYRHMLQERISRRSLEASGLKVEFLMKGTLAPPKERLSSWNDKVIPEFEPLLELNDNSEFKIYSQLGKRFIEPRLNNDSVDDYSILLYGPPGTGKSTVGKNIAKTLGWKFITVTPSDFLAGGSAEVEARAKFIFNCLEEQRNSVILFDEIDHFLLDRESEEYKNQTGIFQFMTPGMLPKINDLKSRRRCIFIIATNYEERIDPAIKRPGRIDYKAPLMPPAYLQRRRIIDDLNDNNKLKHKVSAEDSTGCTYTDLTGDGIPLLSLKEYDRRFIESNDSSKTAHLKEESKAPYQEYALLRLIMTQDCSKANPNTKLLLDPDLSNTVDKEIETSMTTAIGEESFESFKAAIIRKSKIDE